ncbi:DUF2905 family protein [Methylomonas sp. MED-D]|uniref:DUF2905 domain-containing protein n=1 Tax=Methylomonas koyamae TaxID=702114 RepID=A0A177NCY9_9GAMM|nr:MULTISPECIES: DUF2905 family protein [Methylomonas]NJA07708.1 DUF2905 domain-containing protein [Methylococcaceae bacterium WWC4]MDT4332520.1 DUF2905 family protein [Methylomonas sp. MV1]OAI15303.1 hypothetical protein A1355_10950 [Methylomonas koyamae]OHX34718.1 hypothetical protein BJL95_19270 [Methylomonas sp. LWB]WGS85320.1 DUF2905 family protein [Methylomonas sp. UP202]
MVGKILTIAGAGLLLLGLAISHAPWLLNWFGKLPGDISIQTENSRVFIPITSMLVVSLLLSLLSHLILRK